MDIKRRTDDTKLLWHMDRVSAYFDRGERVAPIYIDMGLTKSCNIRCVFCYGVYQHLTGEHIDPQVLVQLFHDAPLVGIKGIGMVGDGEPTLNPGLYDALDAGGEHGLDMAISTNGLLLNTDARREKILQRCTWMRFNISAGTREGYKKIHTVDAFDRVVGNIRRTVEIKRERGYACEIGLQCVFIPGLMNEEVVAEAKLAVDLGVDYFLVKQCSLPDDNMSVNNVSITPESAEHPDTIAALRAAEAQARPGTDIIVKWVLMAQQQQMSTTGRRPYNGCLGIPFLLQISGNGKVYPCGYLFGKNEDEYRMGDLHKDSIGTIITSDRYWEIVQRMREFDVHAGCHGACRQDKVNEFCYTYNNRPLGINFI